MPTTIRTRRITNQDGQTILTFQVGPEVFNYPGSLQCLANLTGQKVHATTGEFGIAIFTPTTDTPEIKLPQGYYNLQAAVKMSDDELFWRQRCPAFFIEGNDNDSQTVVEPLELICV